MEDKLLSISEAAKLIGVCENTLRDWDIESKFKADRTIGGHRRYSLDKIREYIEKNFVDKNKEVFIKPKSELLIEKWSKTEFIKESDSIKDKEILSILLENATGVEHRSNNLFSQDQLLWLTREAWMKIRFRNMVSVQPLNGPCNMIYIAENIDKGLKIKDEIVISKTQKYEFNFFNNANFEDVKNLYAECLAHEIDEDILRNLPKIKNCYNFSLRDNIVKFSEMDIDLKSNYDYMMVIHNAVDEIKRIKSSEGVDVYGIDTRLDGEDFQPLTYAGKYPKNSLTKPIFCPYILVLDAPLTLTSLMRSAMFCGDWIV